MRRVAYVRRGARAGICVLALGVTAAAAQQTPAVNPADQSTGQPAATGTENVKPAEASGTQATAPSSEPTSNLPELIVNDDAKKKKKVVKAKQVPLTTSTATSTQTEGSDPPPPSVILGGAPSDTGMTTYDASAVKARTDGGGDANSFLRNLPNIQYQNVGGTKGADSQSTIDTKPQAVSISGARTYENNIILNGVSITNITGPSAAGLGEQDTSLAYSNNAVYGVSAQNIYVPADFVGQATVIDSNASAEYGQFQGGVVMYDLMAPPTDRYHASVSAGRDSSEFASYILATPDGSNPNKRLPPRYDKTNLSASVGAPITSDFAFIAQVSRKEAESSKPYGVQISDEYADENSDNVFMRFAATAKTDIGKFTFDTSRTDYFQHWVYFRGIDMHIDTNTVGTSTKLEHDANLSALNADEIGLGSVKVKSRIFYNTSETQNNSGGSVFYSWIKQRLTGQNATTKLWANQIFYTPDVKCPGVDKSTYTGANGNIQCNEGGWGNTLQGQVDYGAQSTMSGDILLGKFKIGTELKSYEGRNARLEDFYYASSTKVTDVSPTGAYVCTPGDKFCSPYQYAKSVAVYQKHDTKATVNALHSFAELDQSWYWFNVRAGMRYDFDDYLENNNFAPRLVGTIKPIDGLSFTGGYNRYYLGETLYYALLDKMPTYKTLSRTSSTDPLLETRSTDTVGYTAQGLATPYDDEYTGAVAIRDPLLGGQIRLTYLERYGHDQFATEVCPDGSCKTATNDGTTFYRSASAEYNKVWNRLDTQFFLNAASFTGNVTWSKQQNSKNTYLLNSDLNGDGVAEDKVWYNGQPYPVSQFDSAITGNLDIPVRFGATLSTVWLDGLLDLNATAGISLGFSGVYDTGDVEFIDPRCPNGCNIYADRTFNPTLKLDLSAQIHVTEQASIVLNANNVTNSAQSALVTSANANNPWVLGRSYWLGSSLKF